MKIEIKDFPTCLLKDIPVGDAFIRPSDREVFYKTAEGNNNGTLNKVVSARTGKMEWFAHGCNVIPVKRMILEVE